MSAARPLLAASAAIAALTLSLAVPERAPSRAVERDRPTPRLAGLASVPLLPVAAPAPVAADPVDEALEPPSGPRRCAPIDPLAWRPEPGPGRQRCGEPRALIEQDERPARTRCGTLIPD